MEEYSITVRDLKIRYKSVQAYSIKKSLLRLKGVDTEAFEAVRGISFDVKQGEILGITGKNGSGKSTLLRALANIFSADEGSIDLHGHSVSLLAIGVGFKNEMTGRENIMLSGMLLGFSEKVREWMKLLILRDLVSLLICRYVPIPVVCTRNWPFQSLPFLRQTLCSLMKSSVLAMRNSKRRVMQK